MPAKAIVLLSGGLDSAVAAGWAERHFGECLALSFNYGQRHLRELEASYNLARHYSWERVELNINIPAWSALTNQGEEINKEVRGLPASFVPGRNLIFLSFAASLAYNCRITKIVGGWNAVDYPGYPDCRPEFLTSVTETINKALGIEDIKLYHPLISLTKAQIIGLGTILEVPLKYTWSCYLGGEKPCGTCSSCLFRAQGFKEAGKEDPWGGGEINVQ
jgi:7-cyano-7-deazaguanine synthase